VDLVLLLLLLYSLMPTRPKGHGRLAAAAAPDRGTAASRGYGAQWQKARLVYLAQHPLCVACAKQGRTTAATVVDHVRPHRGCVALFWDMSNWQALCRRCHCSKTAHEDGGFGNGLT
jgi:5-methylcytosine-specific restriction protein A